MSTAQALGPVKRHIDGGTFRTLASAETRNRWRITLTEWITYRGETRYEVNRETPDAKLFRLAHFAIEAEARAFANREYRAATTERPRQTYITEAGVKVSA